MQRANLPLSYPMTARRFLERHGLLDAQEYQRRLVQQGDPEALSVQYPLSDITFRDGGTRHNLLILTVDGLNNATVDKALPSLNQFASENVRFTQHYSAGLQPEKACSVCSTVSPPATWTACWRRACPLPCSAR